jgi:hypothetical protein
MKIYSELFALEKAGRYQDALDRIKSMSNETKNNSPISCLNLKLLEQRLYARLKIADPEIKNARPLPEAEREVQRHRNQATWSAIVTMWKRKEYLAEQLAAIRSQSIPPEEIIIILNEGHILESEIREIGGSDIKVIRSDINSLYSRWAIAYIALGEFVSVFDDDVIPGEYWIENAIRTCLSYNALVGPAGRIFNKNGIHGFYELVVPNGVSEKNRVRDCSFSDVFCDWVCNSYLFKREWAGFALADKRYKDHQKTFDDIQLATSLFMTAGINCMVPMQPLGEIGYHGSLKREYGNDKYAIWLTNSDQHFSNRKSYIEWLVDRGYVCVKERPNLHRIHLIIPFADRRYLERCLISVKGQIYENYTCTLIDDCCDGRDQVNLLIELGLDLTRFRYLKTKKNLFSLRTRELGTDSLDAALSDVIVHLDGDDWLCHSQVLNTINESYSNQDIHASYGNGVSFFPKATKNPFWNFYELYMSKKWGYAEKLNENDLVEPYRRLSPDDIKDGWKSIPWGAFHMRTFKHHLWRSLDRTHFKINEEYLRSSTDAAIFLPMLAAAGLDRIEFISDCIYGYMNSDNTIHAKNFIEEPERLKIKSAIRSASLKLDTVLRNKILRVNEKSYELQSGEAQILRLSNPRDNVTSSSGIEASKLVVFGSGAVVSIITPNYLPDGLIAVKSFQVNVSGNVHSYLFVSIRDKSVISQLESIAILLGFKLLHPDNLVNVKQEANKLEAKYGLGADEYRWAMKSLVIIELIKRGYDFAVFQDPDMYTVAPIDDIIKQLLVSGVMVFPHFRNPKDDYLRKVLYRDGFFNGGMIGATLGGLNLVWQFYDRCLNEMKKEPERDRWDDQKYLDLWVLESNIARVNLDKGIDYNPWNYDPIEGMVAPSQRSYLLKSGYFIRNWHVSTNMIKQTIEGHLRHIVYKPIVAIYMHTLMVFIGIISVCLKKADFPKLPGIEERWVKSLNTLRAIASGDTFGSSKYNIETVDDFISKSVSESVDLLIGLVNDGISFDNIELYREAMSGLIDDAYLEVKDLGPPDNSTVSSELIISELLPILDITSSLHNLRSANINL